MGFTIFLHHTNPEVAWFLVRDEWAKNETQLCSTVHAQFLIPFDSFFHHIYQHTAHHLDVCIPFYNLRDAQFCIEMAFAEKIVSEKLSFKKFLEVTRKCKLYDYEIHCWTDFNGRVTARTRLGRIE